MTVRARPGISFAAQALHEHGADCSLGEHRWEIVDRMGTPPLWKCASCGVYGFIRRKGGAHRNGRFVIYVCSAEGCKKPGRIRSRYRGTGGAFDWACAAEHAKGSKFEGRVPPPEGRKPG